MRRTISMIFIAASAAFILGNSASAQYPQDSTRRMPRDTTMRRMQSDTTMRRMPGDTVRGLYHYRSTDTSMQRGRINKDTARVRPWTPDNHLPDSSSGIH